MTATTESLAGEGDMRRASRRATRRRRRRSSDTCERPRVMRIGVRESTQPAQETGVPAKAFRAAMFAVAPAGSARSPAQEVLAWVEVVGAEVRHVERDDVEAFEVERDAADVTCIIK